MTRGGWTYIMASRPHGMLYVGVTNHLAARVDQHRRDEGSAYCRKFGIKTLVSPNIMTTFAMRSFEKSG